MKLSVVLIDTVSIQNYIFSSNRLKINVGASFIVKNIFEKELTEVLRGIGNGSYEWRTKPEQIHIQHSQDIWWEIGYVGGGNALIFFKNQEDAKKFIQNYSKNILLKYPGLNLAFGVNDDFDLSNFKESISKLHKDLQKNKNTRIVRSTLSKYGFTLECKESNESAEDFRDENDYISSVIKAKLDHVDSANRQLQEILSGQLDGFQFTNEFENIAPESEKSYIAVVHIDGNSMGDRFKACNDIISLRKLSISVEEATLNATRNTVNELSGTLKDTNIIDKIGIKLYKNVLPFRPIIIGGDDITFVCNGKLGIYLAKVFINNFIFQDVIDGQPLSACGGIAIVKTKFPFFKAYQLAVELTHSAKKKSRKIENSSFIDFHISSGGFSGTWLDIKNRHYAAVEGNAHYGPYRIDAANDEFSLQKLESIIEDLFEKPRNKVLQLRELILKSNEEIERFIKENEEFERVHSIWSDGRTRYFDALEAMEFYHSILHNK